ncbi:hypothetical protein ZWY2020_035101 [Hordeum vulgare]|nr:hypothetical protein ZWY2020_035101 [Hordeum vulgare]
MRKQWLVQPQNASVDLCYFVGITNERVLYIASIGYSCDVRGRVERGVKHNNASFGFQNDWPHLPKKCIREPLLAWFHIPRPFHKPIPCPEPSIEEHRLCVEYWFVIFASEGLWEELRNASSYITSVPLQAMTHTRCYLCAGILSSQAFNRLFY